jgi:hypothetical protein
MKSKTMDLIFKSQGLIDIILTLHVKKLDDLLLQAEVTARRNFT